MKVASGYLITPSGILKESTTEDDIFTLDIHGNVLESPTSRLRQNLKFSSCFPNFQHIYRLRPDTEAIYHTHSPLAVVASLLASDKNQFSCSNLQMVKAMRGHKWTDTINIPIIGNKDTEDAIAVDLEKAVRDNPNVDAVLIRGHGLYVWAPSWEAAKVTISKPKRNSQDS